MANAVRTESKQGHPSDDNAAPGPIVVLQSFRTPRPTTNPYIVMLGETLRTTPGVVLLNFSWRRALFGRFDVFHVHWPEILVNGSSPLKRLARQMLTFGIVLRMRLSRIPIVRTVHNLGLPEGISRREVLLLRLIDRWTTLRIRLNTATDLPADCPAATILHGDYRTWFAAHPASEPVPGQFGYVGLIRRYKGVERLIEAFAGTSSVLQGLTLRIGGKPSSPELVDAVTRGAAADSRIALDLHFLTDDELVGIVTSSELVVLPYRFMHNSGGALAALSLGRPILLPDNEVNRRLSEEVGPGWVHLFDGELTASDLIDAITEVRRTTGRPAPRLVARSWDDTGRAHREAYRAAIAARSCPRTARSA
jgi:beta-1,4-mannosyltransferase